MSGHGQFGGGRPWQISESHLLPDAVVAFVDGELSLGAHERAAEHVARCPSCAADVAAQRQARSAVQDADTPCTPAGLLASLRSIPQATDLPKGPDNLALTTDGQLVAVQRPDRAHAAGLTPMTPPSPFGSAAPLGTSGPLGSSGNVLGARFTRRAAQGAGVVVSGVVLSALALVVTSSGDAAEEAPSTPSGGPATSGVLRAQFGKAPAPDRTPASAPVSAPVSVPAAGTAPTGAPAVAR